MFLKGGFKESFGMYRFQRVWVLVDWVEVGGIVGQLFFGENFGRKVQVCVCRQNRSERGGSGVGEKVVGVVCIQRQCVGFVGELQGEIKISVQIQ